MEGKQKNQSSPSRTATTNPTPPPVTQTAPPLQRGIHQRGNVHGPFSRLCITREQKLTLKLIEKKRNELDEEKSRLENDGNQVIILLGSMLLLYMLVFGGGLGINWGPLVAYITSKKNAHTLIITVVAIVCTFVAGLGLHILLAFQKLKRLSRKNTIIQQQIVTLKAESEAFRRELNIAYVGIEVGSSSGVISVSVASSGLTLESASTRIKACIDSLGSDYFHRGHMLYLLSTGAIGVIFLWIIVTLLVFSYTEHKDSVKLGQASFPSLI